MRYDYQSRFFKPAASAVICALLLLVGILYCATRHAGQSASERGTPVRHTKPLVSEKHQNKLTVLPTLGPSSPKSKSDEAYVALQYGSFFLALRVLGQSLRESGTKRDMVALVMPSVPQYQRQILKREGWIIRTVNPLPKGCVGDHSYSQHFVKIQSWLLTEYRRVVLIDSDAIALRNIDALFGCGEFCAAYRHSDLFNTGVVVLKPSEETFVDMCSKIQTLGSFTNGDQGFLNYYYKDMKKATMFSSPDSGEVVVGDGEQVQRLPAEYNGDVSIPYLTNKWMYLDSEEPFVLHYTLGPVKPWMWWTYPLFSLNWRWKELRDRLPPTQMREPSLADWRSWFPLVVLLVLGLTPKLWCRHYTSLVWRCSTARLVSRHLSSPYCTNTLPLLMLLLAAYTAFQFVPLTMDPFEAYIRFGLWTLLFFCLPFSSYCHLIYLEGGTNGENGRTGKNDDSPLHTNSSGQSIVTPWRILGEGMLWLALSATLFYLQFSITVLQVTMKGRVFSYFGFILANMILCFWYGKRLTTLCKQ